MIDNPIIISISALPTITPHLAQSTSQVIKMQLFDIYRPWARVGAAAFSNRVQPSSNSVCKETAGESRVVFEFAKHLRNTQRKRSSHDSMCITWQRGMI
jgi:hypothetical protein